MEEKLLLKKYRVTEKLGEGTYGEVSKAKDIRTGKIVAVKKIKTFIENEGIPTLALREILSLKKLKHPNIVGLLDVHFDSNQKFFYLGNFEIIFCFRGITWKLVKIRFFMRNYFKTSF